MSIDPKLYESLRKGQCKVIFKSVNSGKEVIAPCTLVDGLLPSHHQIHQQLDSTAILVWRLDKKRWEDIQNDSIIHWETITNASTN